jgi:hypothetical protein
MSRIMSRVQTESTYLNLFYCVTIIFECDNIIILSLIIFYLN